MPKVPITVMGYRCNRCGHEWVPRGGGDRDPHVCAKCKSPYWNRPRVRPVKDKAEASGDAESDAEGELTIAVDEVGEGT